MKQFKIYQHPDGTRQAVKQGWSWPGFFFGPIWALVKKLWGIGSGLLVLAFVLSIVPPETDLGLIAAILMLAIYIVCGVNGNNWREKNLVSRGFDHVNSISAANPDGAIALHLKGDNSPASSQQSV